MSYAAIYRLAVREADRIELGRAIARVEVATHAVIDTYERSRVCCYGSLRTCEDFAAGMKRCIVVPFTAEMKEQETAHKVRVWRNP